MEQFALGNLVAQLQRIAVLAETIDGGTATEADRKQAMSDIRSILDLVKGLGGYPVSEYQAADLYRYCQGAQGRSSIPIATQRRMELEKSIVLESKSKLFLHLSERESELFRAKAPFGESVAARFPSAALDIVEAGHCLALSRPTACSVHLMRALDIAFSELHREIVGRDIDTPNWWNLIDSIDKVLSDAQGMTKGKEAKRKFYAAARALFNNVRLGWRNDTMHPGCFYTESQARSLYDSVRVFMEFLAEGLAPAAERAPTDPGAA